MEIALAVGAIVLLVLAFFIIRQPDEFRVARSRVIPASASAIFPYVNDTHKFNEWSPFMRMDMNTDAKYEGPASGVGARFHWDSKGKCGSGAGNMTCMESRANEFTRQRLEFIRPFKGLNTAEFSLVPEGSGTKVTWTFYGPMNFMSKCVGIFMNCSKMMEGTFDDGLRYLEESVTGNKPAKAA